MSACVSSRRRRSCSAIVAIVSRKFRSEKKNIRKTTMKVAMLVKI